MAIWSCPIVQNKTNYADSRNKKIAANPGLSYVKVKFTNNILSNM